MRIIQNPWPLNGSVTSVTVKGIGKNEKLETKATAKIMSDENEMTKEQLARHLERMRLCGKHGFKSYLELEEELTTLKQSNAELAAKVERMGTALQRIIDGVPANDNGQYFVEHHDPDGNYTGSENVDPVSVIQCMVGVAVDALIGNPIASPLASWGVSWEKLEPVIEALHICSNMDDCRCQEALSTLKALKEQAK